MIREGGRICLGASRRPGFLIDNGIQGHYNQYAEILAEAGTLPEVCLETVR